MTRCNCKFIAQVASGLGRADNAAPCAAANARPLPGPLATVELLGVTTTAGTGSDGGLEGGGAGGGGGGGLFLQTFERLGVGSPSGAARRLGHCWHGIRQPSRAGWQRGLVRRRPTGGVGRSSQTAAAAQRSLSSLSASGLHRQMPFTSLAARDFRCLDFGVSRFGV